MDRNWHIPHFEKMLYDQGQLMSAYANAYKITHDAQYLEYAHGIFKYIMKDLYHPLGAFFSGEDADSLPTFESKQKVEGAFYAWTWEEVKNAIQENCKEFSNITETHEKAFEIYAYHYDLKPKGNVEPASDPHGHLNAKNVLIVKSSKQDTCSNFNIELETLNKVLDTTNNILHNIRDQRPRPHLDTKIICSWNGLVLSGLSKLANCGSEQSAEYLKAAQNLVKFVQQHLFDAERKQLRRSCYGVGTQNESLEVK